MELLGWLTLLVLVAALLYPSLFYPFAAEPQPPEAGSASPARKE